MSTVHGARQGGLYALIGVGIATGVHVATALAVRPSDFAPVVI